jgi:hypothetical protein
MKYGASSPNLSSHRALVDGGPRGLEAVGGRGAQGRLPLLPRDQPAVDQLLERRLIGVGAGLVHAPRLLVVEPAAGRLAHGRREGDALDRAQELLAGAEPAQRTRPDGQDDLALVPARVQVLPEVLDQPAAQAQPRAHAGVALQVSQGLGQPGRQLQVLGPFGEEGLAAPGHPLPVGGLRLAVRIQLGVHLALHLLDLDEGEVSGQQAQVVARRLVLGDRLQELLEVDHVTPRARGRTPSDATGIPAGPDVPAPPGRTPTGAGRNRSP